MPRAYAVLVAGIVCVTAGCGGTKHSAPVMPVAPRPFTVSEVMRAFAAAKLSLVVDSRLYGEVTLFGSETFNAEPYGDPVTVYVSPRSPAPGDMIYVIVQDGYRQQRARNVEADYPRGNVRLAKKVRAALALLGR